MLQSQYFFPSESRDPVSVTTNTFVCLPHTSSCSCIVSRSVMIRQDIASIFPGVFYWHMEHNILSYCLIGTILSWLWDAKYPITCHIRSTWSGIMTERNGTHEKHTHVREWHLIRLPPPLSVWKMTSTSYVTDGISKHIARVTILPVS